MPAAGVWRRDGGGRPRLALLQEPLKRALHGQLRGRVVDHRRGGHGGGEALPGRTRGRRRRHGRGSHMTIARASRHGAAAAAAAAVLQLAVALVALLPVGVRRRRHDRLLFRHGDDRPRLRQIKQEKYQ